MWDYHVFDCHLIWYIHLMLKFYILYIKTRCKEFWNVCRESTCWNCLFGVQASAVAASSVLPSSSRAPGDLCYFCKSKVYLVERHCAEGLYFHRTCFRCHYCHSMLRLGAYAFRRGDNPQCKDDHDWFGSFLIVFLSLDLDFPLSHRLQLLFLIYIFLLACLSFYCSSVIFLLSFLCIFLFLDLFFCPSPLPLFPFNYQPPDLPSPPPFVSSSMTSPHCIKVTGHFVYNYPVV